MVNLIDILSYPDKGIIFILNPKKNKLLIAPTMNIINYLYVFISQIRDNTYKNKDIIQDKEDLVLMLLSPKYNNPMTYKYLASEYAKKYTTSGYTLYNKNKFMEIKKHIQIINYCTRLKVGVFIKTRRDCILIKEFDFYTEAESYCNSTSLVDMLESSRTK